MPNLGDRVQDKISGLKGIVTGRTEFLYGCVRLMVQAEEVKDGKPAESVWVDEPQLDVVDVGVITREVTPAASPRNHGPRADHTARPDASR